MKKTYGAIKIFEKEKEKEEKNWLQYSIQIDVSLTIKHA